MSRENHTEQDHAEHSRDDAAPLLDNLPDTLPLFPLTGALLLPRGELPLNIFEPRYIQMVDDALRSDRMIAMIQPKESGAADLFDIGCAGRITHFEDNGDDTYLIKLTGISRFHLTDTYQADGKDYLGARVDWADFHHDRTPPDTINLDRAKLKTLLGPYFEKMGFDCASDIIDTAPDERIITCLPMICPLSACEKQALLEARCYDKRAEKLMTLLELAAHTWTDCDGKCH